LASAFSLSMTCWGAWVKVAQLIDPESAIAGGADSKKATG